MALTTVTVIDVDVRNYEVLLPSIKVALENSYFISIDLEFSGVGDKHPKTSTDEKYLFDLKTVRDRAILSLGLSTFSAAINHEQDNAKAIHFNVQTFNILGLITDNFILEPKSAKFLLEHGFDFNKQFLYGVPYHRGNDNDTDSLNNSTLRSLFTQILISKKPLVIHNGLLDLLFLYDNLYCDLPANLQTFISDLVEMFPNGIFDTKYILEYQAKINASYLQYAFRFYQRQNEDQVTKNDIYIKPFFTVIDNANSEAIKQVDVEYNPQHPVADANTICNSFAYHGWCSNNNSCSKSHKIDDMVDYLKTSPKKKKRLKHEKGVPDLDKVNTSAEMSKFCHSAGMDSFMTGYIFVSFLITQEETYGEELSKMSTIQVIKNKIYLMCKQTPLIVIKSIYTRPSKSHARKYKKINEQVGDQNEVTLN